MKGSRVGMAWACLALGLGSSAALAAPQAERAFVFFPTASAPPPNGVDLYQLPLVQARVYEDVGGRRTDVTLPDSAGEVLLEAFAGASGAPGIADVRLLGTLIIEANRVVGPDNEPYVAYVVERTIACLQAIDDEEVAEDFADFIANPAGDATTPAELEERAETFRVVADDMLDRFRADRCASVANDFAASTVMRERLQGAARVLLLGESSLSMTDSDVFVAAGALEALYFGAEGLFAVRARQLLREAILANLPNLATEASTDDTRSFADPVDFLAFHRKSGASALGRANARAAVLACVEDLEAMFEGPFSLAACVAAGGVVFHSIGLESTTRYFAEGFQ
jgi:hypothetical protein